MVRSKASIQMILATSVAALNAPSACRAQLQATSAPRFQFAMSARRHLRTCTIMCKQPARILAYGDSLTAGTFNQAEPDDLYPYAPTLETALGNAAIVRHRGLPGFTAQFMLDNVDDADLGLCGILRKIRDPPIALAILLAGTNDVGCRTSADDICSALIGLHQAAHKLEVRTLAVGIPPSGFLTQDATAASTVAEVNERLRTWCSTQPNELADFVPHPIRKYEAGGALWSRDGLHLSPEGYAATGEGLAEAVRRRLTQSSSGSSARAGTNIIY